MALISLKRRIAEEYKRHEYILKSEKLCDEKERYLKIQREHGDAGDYTDSLYFLSECLYKYHNKKAIILIDEYDVPLENSFFRGFYDEMIDFMRSLFESALKTNPYLEFSIITGCLCISKESIFTGLNNLNIISILDDKYAEYFGFIDEEVFKITQYYGLEEKYELIKNWYNGYVFGNINVYNPWSVVKFIDDLRTNKNVFPSSYWANTSSNSIVKSLIERADDVTKGEIEALIMYDAIINKNTQVFEEELGSILIHTISFNDAYENFYHGFVAGTLMNMKGYIVKSNREGGSGRSDIFIRAAGKITSPCCSL